MIYIEKGERAALPGKFRKINNVCAILYDLLTEILAAELYQPLQRTPIALREGEQEHFNAQESEQPHVLDFLTERGYQKELEAVLIKHVTLAILSDMLHFIYESLSCAKRGKITVAYALLRKPFKDELLMLESILTDPTGFIQNFFFDGNPDTYDPIKVSADRKKEILKSTISRVHPDLFDAAILHEFRYDRTSPVGLTGLADHALHIVTGNPSYRTGRQNLNFVFSNQEDIEDYWQHYYRMLPYLLLYTSAVSDAILFPFLDSAAAKERYEQKSFKRLLGYFLWINKSAQPDKQKAMSHLNAIRRKLVLTCDHCGHQKKIRNADIDLFFAMEIIICEKCVQQIPFNSSILSSIV